MGFEEETTIPCVIICWRVNYLPSMARISYRILRRRSANMSCESFLSVVMILNSFPDYMWVKSFRRYQESPSKDGYEDRSPFKAQHHSVLKRTAPNTGLMEEKPSRESSEASENLIKDKESNIRESEVRYIGTTKKDQYEAAVQCRLAELGRKAVGEEEFSWNAFMEWGARYGMWPVTSGHLKKFIEDVHDIDVWDHIEDVFGLHVLAFAGNGVLCSWLSMVINFFNGISLRSPRGFDFQVQRGPAGERDRRRGK